MKKATKIIIAILVAAALIIPAYAAAESFTPSVSQKGAPEVAEVLDKDGNTVAAIVYDENGQEIAGLASASIVVTPLADALDEETGVSEVTREALTQAYDSIEEAGSLAAAAPKVEEALKETDSGLTMEQLVVRDVFHVAPDQATLDAIAGSQKIALSFDMEAQQDDFIMVMRYVDGEWIPVDMELVTINEDGTVTVVLDLIDGQVGTIALLTELIVEE